MRNRHRKGKVSSAQVVLVPVALVIAGLLLFNVYRWFVPAGFTIASTEPVEALEVIRGVSPLRKNGLLVAQAESLRSGGSARLVVTHPAEDGGFLLVSGRIANSFIKKHIPLDSMLHLKVNSREIRVESGGEPVDAVVLLSRTETNPLRVDDPSTDPDVDVISLLYTNQTLLPVPSGSTSDGDFTSDNGMTIQCSVGMGRTGAVSLGDSVELHFTLDPQSSAWVEMPRSVNVQHTAVGAEDLDIGVLIPRDTAGTEPYTISLFGEVVATILRQ